MDACSLTISHDIILRAVLASKGIDPTLVDKRVERKASVVKLTGKFAQIEIFFNVEIMLTIAQSSFHHDVISCILAEQDKQVEDLRKELTEVEEKLREANENELPEEEYRVAAEEKRQELNKLMKEFAEMNVTGASADGEEADAKDSKPERKHFERPSERRRRLEQKRREERGYNDGGYGGQRYDDNDGGDDTFKSFGNRNNRRSSGGRGGGSGYYDRNDRGGSYGGDRGGSYRGGGDRGGSYRDGGGDRGSYRDGGRRSNNYNEKYASDRYNY